MADNNEKPSGTNSGADLADKAGEVLLKSITGFKPTDKTTISLFPDRKEALRIDYNGTDKEKPSAPHVEAEAIAGFGSLKINRAVYTSNQTKKPEGFVSITKSYELGILAEDNKYGTSLLGNKYPAAPQLGNLPSVDIGTSGGIGYRYNQHQVGDDGTGLKLGMQLAATPATSFIASPTKTAPSSSLSMAYEGITNNNFYAVGAAAFIQEKKPGVQLAANHQNRIGEGTLNVSGELIASEGMRLRTANVEYSTPVTIADRDIIPYASAQLTQARGSMLPDGVSEGSSKSLNLGIAQKLATGLLWFVEGRAESDHKPSVNFGIIVGDKSATFSKGHRK